MQAEHQEFFKNKMERNQRSGELAAAPHQNENVEEEQRSRRSVLRCSQCGMAFDDAAVLKLHLTVTHLGWIPFACADIQCGATVIHLPTEHAVEQHFRAVHPGRTPKAILDVNEEKMTLLYRYFFDSLSKYNRRGAMETLVNADTTTVEQVTELEKAIAPLFHPHSSKNQQHGCKMDETEIVVDTLMADSPVSCGRRKNNASKRLYTKATPRQQKTSPAIRKIIPREGKRRDLAKDDLRSELEFAVIPTDAADAPIDVETDFDVKLESTVPPAAVKNSSFDPAKAIQSVFSTTTDNTCVMCHERKLDNYDARSCHIWKKHMPKPKVVCMGNKHRCRFSYNGSATSNILSRHTKKQHPGESMLYVYHDIELFTIFATLLKRCFNETAVVTPFMKKRINTNPPTPKGLNYCRICEKVGINVAVKGKMHSQHVVSKHMSTPGFTCSKCTQWSLPANRHTLASFRFTNHRAKVHTGDATAYLIDNREISNQEFRTKMAMAFHKQV